MQDGQSGLGQFNKNIGLLVLSFVGMVQAPTQVELAYDDGIPDQYYSRLAGGQLAVKFSLPTEWTRAKILTAKYYFSFLSTLAQFEVNIYDSDGTTELITPFSVTPAGGWVDVDLSSLNVVVDDDFYIVIEWLTDADPDMLGQDRTAIDMRSYLRTSASDAWTLITFADNMIRAVVEEQEEPPPEVSEFPLGWTIEILLIPVVIYMLWKTKRTSNGSSLH